jgi:hypothetical protein
MALAAEPQPVLRSKAAPVRSRYVRWAIVAMVLLASCEFLDRGVVRGVHSGQGVNDFLSPYVQSRAWLKALDPYDPRSVVALWPNGATRFEFLAGELADGSLTKKRGIPTAYPLPSLVMLAPLALVRWPLANALWLGITASSFFLMWLALISYSGMRQYGNSSLIFLGTSLALAPFHTGLATANPAILATELGVISLWTSRRSSDWTTGLLLAFSSGLKPQIGLIFLGYLLLQKRWRVFAIAVVIVSALTLIAAARLEYAHVSWVSNYVQDTQMLLGNGILSDFRPVNPTRFGLLNVQLVLYPIVQRVGAVDVLAGALVGIVLALWAGLTLATRSSKSALLQLSALSVASLLPVYHRFYDAALLVLPLCWYCANWRELRGVFRIGPLLIMAFFFPGGSMLETLQNAGRIPPKFAASWWWNEFVMPHDVWILLLLVLLLLWQMGDMRHVQCQSRPGL